METYENRQNSILIDWLTFTIKGVDEQYIKELIGLSDVNWLDNDRGALGYRYSESFGNILIAYNDPDQKDKNGNAVEMGVCCSMSGSGCRDFESFSKVGFCKLIMDVLSDGGNITRLDIAYDDYTGVLDLDKIENATKNHEYVSKCRYWSVISGSEGRTIYFGSNQSDTRIRFYDKAAERKLDSSVHWIRCELQLRKNSCLGFVQLFPLPLDFSSDNLLEKHFKSVILHYLRFVDVGSDSNLSRCHTSDWWTDFIGCVNPESIFIAPGTDYNIQKLDDYVFRTASQAVGTAITIYGRAGFFDLLAGSTKDKKTPDKYRHLLEKYSKNQFDGYLDLNRFSTYGGIFDGNGALYGN